MEEAKRLLVERRQGIDEIAVAVGMGSADTLRHHFRRRAGISPQSYRDQFGVPQSAEALGQWPLSEHRSRRMKD